MASHVIIALEESVFLLLSPVAATALVGIEATFGHSKSKNVASVTSLAV